MVKGVKERQRANESVLVEENLSFDELPLEPIEECLQSSYGELKPADPPLGLQGVTEGQCIQGRYLLLQHLGEGCLGKVFLARDQQHQSLCVVKLLYSQIAADTLLLSRLVHELEVATHLQLPGFVSPIEKGTITEPQSYCIVMEYLSGHSLANEIDERKRQGCTQPYTPHEALRFLEQIVAHLSEIHERQLVHRNLKPSNIMLLPEQGIKLLDFGLNLRIQDSSIVMSGARLDAAYYLAPEQQTGENVYFTAATDLFALGVILYKMLTGIKPGAPILRADTSQPRLSKPLESVLWKAMHPRVHLRYFKAETLLHDFRQALREISAPAKAVFSQVPSLHSHTNPRQHEDVRPSSPNNPTYRFSREPKHPTASQASPSQPRRTDKDVTQPSASFSHTFMHDGTTHSSPVHNPFPPRSSKTHPVSSASNVINPLPSKVLEATHTSVPSFEQQNLRSHSFSVSHDSQTYGAFHSWLSGMSPQYKKEWRSSPLRSIVAHSSPVTSMALDPGGNLLASTDGTIVRLWEAGNWEQLSKAKVVSKDITNLAWSSNSRMLAFLAEQNVVHVWDLFREQRLLSLKHDTKVETFTWLSNGRLLCTGTSDHQIHMWNIPSGTKERNFDGHDGPVRILVPGVEDRFLLSGGEEGDIKLWNMEQTGMCFHLVSSQSPLETLTYSASSAVLVSGHTDSSVKLWDLYSGEPLRSWMGHEEAVTSIVTHSLGRWFASASKDQTIKIWDPVSGNLQQNLDKHTAPIHTLCLDVRERWLASAGQESCIHIWDVSP